MHQKHVGDMGLYTFLKCFRLCLWLDALSLPTVDICPVDTNTMIWLYSYCLYQ